MCVRVCIERSYASSNNVTHGCDDVHQRVKRDGDKLLRANRAKQNVFFFAGYDKQKLNFGKIKSTGEFSQKSMYRENPDILNFLFYFEFLIFHSIF